jgi:hypothetical protein
MKTGWNFPLSAEDAIDWPPAERDGSVKKRVALNHLVDRVVGVADRGIFREA